MTVKKPKKVIKSKPAPKKPMALEDVYALIDSQSYKLAF